MSRRRQWFVRSAAVLLALAALACLLDAVFPPSLARIHDHAFVLLDRQGEPLRYRLAADGRLRLPARAHDVDPKLLALLIAYEDKRFWWHPGVDPLAVGRALVQALQQGRVVSGASTLTMQTARLLHPRPRGFVSKCIEVLRAVQLEAHYDKREILGLYLSLAPYGGNLEGVTAAARVWYGKPPIQLTPGEAALLVALPQSPTRLRPDRHPEAARAARAKVLARVGAILERTPRARATHTFAPQHGAQDEYWNERALALARAEPIRLRAQALPLLAPHLADRLIARRDARSEAGGAIDVGNLRSCIDGELQRAVESIARAALPTLQRNASVALLVVDNASAEVRAYVGNADYLATERAGQLDIVRAVRSPGSTLKPFIYGLAFDLDLARPATLALDAPTRFGNYTPANFEQQYYGTVTLIEALRRSLNVPAVTLLDAIGPVRFAGAFAQQGTPLRLPGTAQRPGLALALGGAGTSLEALARHYRALADDGRARALQLECDGSSNAIANASDDASAATDNGAYTTTRPMLSAQARWHLRRILQHVAAPMDRPEATSLGGVDRIAQKTGTSYGFRDAWAFGYDKLYTVGVWVGRADGTPHPGHYGYNTAAPLLFQVFDQLPVGGRTPAAPIDAQLAWTPEALPARMRFIGRGEERTRGPRMLFPLPEATVLIAAPPLQLEAEGGRPPYTWLINGETIPASSYGRAQWAAQEPGFTTATVIDASGAYDRVQFRVATDVARMDGAEPGTVRRLQ